MTTRRQGLFLLPAAAIAPQAFAFDLGRALGAMQTAGSAMRLSDDDLRSHGRRMAEQMDAKAPVAPEKSPHARRLAALTASCREDGGLPLNCKVYMVPEVNAFALPDGSIRFYAGLMDMMTDDEIRYVIGHEIGHVQAGHSRKRMQLALSTGAAQQALAAGGGKAAARARPQGRRDGSGKAGRTARRQQWQCAMAQHPPRAARPCRAHAPAGLCLKTRATHQGPASTC